MPPTAITDRTEPAVSNRPGPRSWLLGATATASTPDTTAMTTGMANSHGHVR